MKTRSYLSRNHPKRSFWSHPEPAASSGWPRLELVPPSEPWSGASPPSSGAPSAPFPSASSSPCAPAPGAPKTTPPGSEVGVASDDISLTVPAPVAVSPAPPASSVAPPPPSSVALPPRKHCYAPNILDSQWDEEISQHATPLSSWPELPAWPSPLPCWGLFSSLSPSPPSLPSSSSCLFSSCQRQPHLKGG